MDSKDFDDRLTAVEQQVRDLNALREDFTDLGRRIDQRFEDDGVMRSPARMCRYKGCVTHSQRNLSTRQRAVRGITVASVGIGLALGAGAGIASADPADPATPSPSQARATSTSPGLDASSITKSVQHQAVEARANVARTQPAQTGTARPAAATSAPKPADAVTGDKPNTPATPIKDAITNLVKTNLLKQLTGGFGKFLGPSR